ncbi:hypothetical protein IMCC3135_19090 [Granulosicoccus antarcticus IMCC3135]|uniref:Uncharacterized protein n=1 Tax=Granulosicoccus antarcticus IMCC3135 TaxID=1192854 RepID=A0A2Z2P0V9_9GAMM|nr:hypothetical protein IMCC3135_19090 [Granulosicoccus antarcticus IMCC3135]
MRFRPAIPQTPWKNVARLPQHGDTGDGIEPELTKRQQVVHTVWDGSGRVARPLAGAKTFTVLQIDSYAKDQHALYRQFVIPDANPATFTLFNDWYAVDRAYTLYNGAILPDRDARTFEIKNDYWTRDAHDVYFLNQAIQACEHVSFTIVFERRAKNAQCTYVNNDRVDGVDRPSFCALRGRETINYTFQSPLHPALLRCLSVE